MNDELSEEIRLFVDKLDIKKAYILGDELWGLCPFHNDHVAKNFSINLFSGKFYCFSCKAGGNAISLANDKGFNYLEAHQLWEMIKKGDEKIDFRFPPEPIDEFTLNLYRNCGTNEKALERANWDYNTLLEYSVYSDKSGDIIYFIYNERGEPVTILNRCENRDYPIIGNYWKDYGFFGGNNLSDTEKIIIVEGIWDAIKIRAVTGYKVLFTGGTSITQKQIEKLKQIENLYFMFDGDKAGRNCRDFIHDNFSDSFYRSYYCGGYNDDPDRLTEIQIYDIIDKAKSWEDYKIWRIENKK